MIDLSIDEAQLARTVRRCRERDIIVPTFAQMKDPSLMPPEVKSELAGVGLWDVHPRNLFRIGWMNEPTARGGGFGAPNILVLPPELTGVPARIVALVGKWFPTGAHKVGATFGCLVPRLVTGHFDPTRHKAVWPSTGNYCRGGAYVAALLGCESIAILPQEMSQERFEWLATVAGEVIATPGCESNVKEIFDKCRELKQNRDDLIIFNQFDEPGNYLWHYDVTGDALLRILDNGLAGPGEAAGVILSSGSSGTLACGDRLKKAFPGLKVGVAEALQCPTLLYNGHGGHRIEGIGDKHVPWIHNVRNTDMAIAVDDKDTLRLLRLFNEPEGRKLLQSEGVDEQLAAQLDWLGISSIANMIASIKFARYYELTEHDIVLTVFTDSLELYGSRLRELAQELGPYTDRHAAVDFERLRSISVDFTVELGYYDRKRIHNLKYFTWIEQQGKDLQELDDQWFDYRCYWSRIQTAVGEIDEVITAFNERVRKSA